MTAGAGFGFRGFIDADQGSKLVILVMWVMPRGDRAAAVPDRFNQAYFGTVRNHSLFSHCFRLDDASEMIAGDWKLAIYLVGIDERVSDARAHLDTHQPTLVYQKTFQLYSPEESHDAKEAQVR